jgi:shikimate dehydrogenase
MTMDLTIRGTTRFVYLLGWPVAHSLSPLIHNHAFASLKLPYVYLPLAVKGSGLHHVIFTMRATGALGANITLPHKQRILPFCDVLSPLSHTLGTVNTLHFRDGQLHGTTTDPEGFLRALASIGHDARGGSVVILGNGGTARTLTAALALERIPKTIALVGRNIQRVTALAAEVSCIASFPVPAYSLGAPELEDLMSHCTLLVNCTSAGMHPTTNETPLDKKYLHKDMTVFDAIYNPAKTRLLTEAEAAGCITQNGLRMLLYQGLASFTLWTGIDVREEIFDLDHLQHQCSRQ